MSTQIYIQPPVTAAGCQPEYTKIVSHSFGFQPSGLPIAGQIRSKIGLHTGGTINITVDYDYPTWAADVRNFRMPYIAGNITDLVYSQISATGIPIPINLVRDDVVTISGNVYFNNLATYLDFEYDVNLVVGVYYFNCKDVNLELGSAAPVFTFMPVSTIPFTDPKKSEVCFEASVKLGSNFDVHDTRLLVGYNIFATCPGECEEPFIDANVATVSYTLDIQRPCKATNTSFIIKNCCEGSITELVNIPGLVVGNFHVDNEGNCWEVMEQSTDVTNFTRTFVDIYATCLECQDANPCPLNLKINSCCVDGAEFVTGSLPGLSLEDTFVDNHGLCWTVAEETGAPISEESITVVTIIEGGCDTCTTENPCPKFYGIESCCTGIKGVIAIPNVLYVGEAFVDTDGICWQVTGVNENQLPTIYGIVVDTVYPIGEGDTCDECTLANPCPTEYFITIKSCCDADRVEVAQVPADYMIFSEGLVFQDVWQICWEVISFSTTGVETYPIWEWGGTKEPDFNIYEKCDNCVKSNSEGCLTMYELKQCGTDTTQIFYVFEELTIGAFYQLVGGDSGVVSCFEVLGYGYPVFGNEYGTLFADKAIPYATCNDCIFASSNIVKNVIWEYCDTPGVTYIAQTTFSGAYSYGLVTTTPDGTRNTCISLLSVTNDPTNSTFDSGASAYIEGCLTCLVNN
jgi:hypothetical protein